VLGNAVLCFPGFLLTQGAAARQAGEYCRVLATDGGCDGVTEQAGGYWLPQVRFILGGKVVRSDGELHGE
jgi:hypothetical protein